jgi:hypothetical protein
VKPKDPSSPPSGHFKTSSPVSERVLDSPKDHTVKKTLGPKPAGTKIPGYGLGSPQKSPGREKKHHPRKDKKDKVKDKGKEKEKKDEIFMKLTGSPRGKHASDTRHNRPKKGNSETPDPSKSPRSSGKTDSPEYENSSGNKSPRSSQNSGTSGPSGTSGTPVSEAGTSGTPVSESGTSATVSGTSVSVYGTSATLFISPKLNRSGRGRDNLRVTIPESPNLEISVPEIPKPVDPPELPTPAVPAPEPVSEIQLSEKLDPSVPKSPVPNPEPCSETQIPEVDPSVPKSPVVDHVSNLVRTDRTSVKDFELLKRKPVIQAADRLKLDLAKEKGK